MYAPKTHGWSCRKRDTIRGEQHDGDRAVRRLPSSAWRRAVETYLLMAFFIALFGSLFLLIFLAVNSEERSARASEKPPLPEHPATVARQRHLHT
jgi:hypothetical protein